MDFSVTEQEEESVETPQIHYGPGDHPLFPRPPFKDPSWMINAIQGWSVHIIKHSDVQDTDDPVTTLGSYELVCSYSWKTTSNPTIYVPGTPALWTPQALPKQLEKDSGKHFVDQHGYRMPRYQFEPIFQALAITNPTKYFDEVQIVINRNSLQKLLAFASMKRNYDQFHLSLDMIGDTLFLGRRERNAQVFSKTSFGRTFECEFTTEDTSLTDAQGHHRIIQYDLGGLQCAIRMEVDAAYHSLNDIQNILNQDPRNDGSGNFLQTIEFTSAVIPHSNKQHTKVIPGGRQIPHNQTIELRTSGGPGIKANKRTNVVWTNTASYSCEAERLAD
jgi:hypothetical protein